MFQAPAGNRSVFDHEVCQSEPGVSPHDLDVKIKMVYDLLVSNSFVDKTITYSFWAFSTWSPPHSIQNDYVWFREK